MNKIKGKAITDDNISNLITSFEEKLDNRIIIDKSYSARFYQCPKNQQDQMEDYDFKGKLNPTILINDLIFERAKVLPFPCFFQEYFNSNEEKLNEVKKDFRMEDGIFRILLESRMYKTYLGFLTEFHGFFLCIKKFGVENVSRDTICDRLGVDFSISNNNIIYNMHFLIDSFRGNSYREKKIEERNSNAINGNHVNFFYLPANWNKAIDHPKLIHICRTLPRSRMGVITEDYVNYLKEEMDNHHIQNDNIEGIDEKGFIYS